LVRGDCSGKKAKSILKLVMGSPKELRMSFASLRCLHLNESHQSLVRAINAKNFPSLKTLKLTRVDLRKLKNPPSSIRSLHARGVPTNHLALDRMPFLQRLYIDCWPKKCDLQPLRDVNLDILEIAGAKIVGLYNLADVMCLKIRSRQVEGEFPSFPHLERLVFELSNTIDLEELSADRLPALRHLELMLGTCDLTRLPTHENLRSLTINARSCSATFLSQSASSLASAT